MQTSRVRMVMRAAALMLVALFHSAGLGSAGAAAETRHITKDVLPERSALIYDIAYHDDETCKLTGYAEIVLTQLPTKGTITINKVSFVPGGGSCAGKSVEGIALRYTAKPGATGTDMLAFHQLFKGAIETTARVKINIR